LYRKGEAGLGHGRGSKYIDKKQDLDAHLISSAVLPGEHFHIWLNWLGANVRIELSPIIPAEFGNTEPPSGDSGNGHMRMHPGFTYENSMAACVTAKHSPGSFLK
jgi:hypothetical protein